MTIFKGHDQFKSLNPVVTPTRTHVVCIDLSLYTVSLFRFSPR